MKFNIITIFPNIINSYCSETILARAQKNNLIKINAVDLRGFAQDKHKTVDDTPYGGGPGMVMKPEPIYSALKKLRAFKKSKILNHKSKITILLSPRGKQFDQRMAERFSKLDEITFVCGRYEGVDQRVADYMIDEEVFIGPYVLAGGELGALVIVEAVARLLPGVLGNEESLNEETYNTASLHHIITTSPIVKKSDEVMGCSSDVVKEYPQYTKPAEFKGWKVPEVLLSGNHGEIERWRKKISNSPNS
ncbi:MAG: tRNA (guanosine(37)-N1)-methyltransferase TrmD [Candidatus Magasanikbacteria bacterium]|nr:tRNA (guanosine(37)-N1)-methyltransferase TrmD [Candidatus Magasanikbacteria bacterium]